ncbi:carboxylesterase family protein [Photobacterium sanguinicancri]|uniref:carboxylesterase family protein n=1 Tax=Photobacterium sanguinicancri TaxID=875932 RepID=UPI0026E2A0D2|nr:carboxylesterase family protein [Photobacterium sanguinicancri]MDO6499181.1 carboxylesterase family protein [Photobacterium sanguinicancri]
MLNRKLIIASLIGLVLTGCNDNSDSTTKNSLTYAYAKANGTQYQGTVEAVKDSKNISDNVEAFKGIKYAKAARFSNAELYTPENSTQTSAVNFGKQCPQGSVARYNATKMSEDCLYLNIWRPTQEHQQVAMPVYVFIHGGSFETGSGSNAINHGDAIVANGVKNGNPFIAVTLNYRLGIFGSFYQNDDESGNYGIKDQRTALKWIKNNIADFGGDPDNVTLFGEGAGAMAVGIHQLNPIDAETNEKLFHRAIMQSNPYGIPYKTKDSAENLATSLEGFKDKTFGGSEAVSVDWSNLSTTEILQVGAHAKNPLVLANSLINPLYMQPYGAGVLPFAPYKETRGWPYKSPKDSVVTKQPADADFKVPTVLSINNDEANAFLGYIEPFFMLDYDLIIPIPDGKGNEFNITLNIKSLSYPALINTVFGADQIIIDAINVAFKDKPLQAILAQGAWLGYKNSLEAPPKADQLLALPHYQMDKNESGEIIGKETVKRARMVANDVLFTCPNRKVAQKNDTRLYHYNYKSDLTFRPIDASFLLSISCTSGVCQGDELPFVFNKNLNIRSMQANASERDALMMDTVSRQWFKPTMFDPSNTVNEQDTVWTIDQNGFNPAPDWDSTINAIPNADGTLSQQGRCDVLEQAGLIKF